MKLAASVLISLLLLLSGCTTNDPRVDLGTENPSLEAPDFSNLVFQRALSGSIRGEDWELWTARRDSTKLCMALVFPPADTRAPSGFEFAGAVVECANKLSAERPILVTGVQQFDDLGLVFVTGRADGATEIHSKNLIDEPARGGDAFVLTFDQTAFFPTAGVTVKENGRQWTCPLIVGSEGSECRPA